jgi:hypothetical protein
VTTRALTSLAAEANSQRESALKQLELIRSDEDGSLQSIRQGRWHDGRLDAVAGNGAMSELGVGIEKENDWWHVVSPHISCFVLH